MSLPKFKSKSIVDILTSIKKENGENLVTKSEAESLTELKFKNGEKILTLQDKNFLYEIIWMLNKIEYVKVYNFLSTDWEKIFGNQNIRKKILFENPLLEPAKEQFELYMEIFKSKIEVSAGERCKKCGSDNTISITAQTRSADEAQTIKIQCLECKFKWISQ
jgi:DNA-directed RNA polymerase subunit M/transcription elongation factor TFIIS